MDVTTYLLFVDTVALFVDDEHNNEQENAPSPPRSSNGYSSSQEIIVRQNHITNHPMGKKIFMIAT